MFTPMHFINHVVKRTANFDSLPKNGLRGGEMQAYYQVGLLLIGMGRISEYIKKGIFHQKRDESGEVLPGGHEFSKHTIRGRFYDIAEEAHSLAYGVLPDGAPEPEDRNHEHTKTELALLNASIGLVGEAIEVFTLLFKALILRYYGGKINREKLNQELGDVAWYMGYILLLIDGSFSDIFQAVDAKLASRYRDVDGQIAFNAELSANRSESLFENES